MLIVRNRRRAGAIARFWIALVAALVVTIDAPAAPPQRVSAKRISEIRQLIRQRVEAGHAAGIVVGILEPSGATADIAFGDPGPGAHPLNGESVFELGSVTKIFTGTLLAEMAQRGEVKLDDPVAKYLPPAVKVPSRNGRQITLVDLATQSSGLPRLMTNLKPANPANPYADYTVKQLYEFLSSYTLTRDVGASYEYSNAGVGLLGHALALRGGMSYEALVTERILRPLGMTRTGITPSLTMRPHMVRGHDAKGNLVPYWDLPAISGAGALRASAVDMLKFVAANLDPAPGQLYRALRETRVVRKQTGLPNTSIGLNWHIRQVGSHQIVWHNGGTGGFRSFVAFDPLTRAGVVVLMNSTQGADDIGFHLMDRTLPLAR